MKKLKAFLIGFIALGLIAGGTLAYLSYHEIWFSLGNCLVTKNNEYMVVFDGGPCIMTTEKENMFKGLETGDQILVLHGGMLLSYPGSTTSYMVIKLSDGDISDIPEGVLKQLEELGWIGDVEEVLEEEVCLIVSEGMTVETRIATPEGYTRTDTTDDENFTNFVRNYSVKEDGSEVLLYNGSKKGNQSAHLAVLELPIEAEDLQQCADSVMRIYAEYYYATEQYDKINFHFVNGFLAEYSKWRDGYRIAFSGNDASWVQSASFDDSYECFQKYMRMVFSYAGTLSMENESEPISLEDARVGDVFLKGGSPGHVVMIIDVCENEEGQKAYLLAQGYMPAQEFHILKNPLHENDPWYYEDEITYPLRTPEYTFPEGSLKRLCY